MRPLTPTWMNRWPRSFSARNLALAEKEKHLDLVAPRSGRFKNLDFANQDMLEDVDLLEHMNYGTSRPTISTMPAACHVDDLDGHVLVEECRPRRHTVEGRLPGGPWGCSYDGVLR